MLKKTALYAESWNVAFRERPAGTILDDTQTPFKVVPNRFRYWAADPFLVKYNEKHYIFAELYDYIRCRGVLGYCEIFGDRAGKWKPIIKEPYHLSYPCMMEYEGKLYLMPESGAGEVLTVYEMVSFPDQWKKTKVLRSGVKFADTTPIPFSDRGLAVTHRVDDPVNPELTLIHLKGHLEDIPVEGRASLRSRPAGHFFEKDGKWFRPAQLSRDTEKGYGKGLVFCKCDLSEDLDYTEAEVRELYPEDIRYDRDIFLDGLHTYNANDQYEVIDIKTRRMNVLNFIMRLLGRILRR